MCCAICQEEKETNERFLCFECEAQISEQEKAEDARQERLSAEEKK